MIMLPSTIIILVLWQWADYTTPLLFQNGPVKKERVSSSSSSFTSSFSFSSRPFSFSQSSTSSITPSSSGAASGGLLSVGRRLAMAMDLHSRPTGSAASPPPPPPSSPAPPLPPRVKGELRLRRFWIPSAMFPGKFTNKMNTLVFP